MLKTSKSMEIITPKILRKLAETNKTAASEKLFDIFRCSTKLPIIPESVGKLSIFVGFPHFSIHFFNARFTSETPKEIWILSVSSYHLDGVKLLLANVIFWKFLDAFLLLDEYQAILNIVEIKGIESVRLTHQNLRYYPPREWKKKSHTISISYCIQRSTVNNCYSKFFLISLEFCHLNWYFVWLLHLKSVTKKKEESNEQTDHSFLWLNVYLKFVKCFMCHCEIDSDWLHLFVFL